MYHYEAHQNLILRDNAGAEFLRTRNSCCRVWHASCPFQERTMSCPKRSREVKPYAIIGAQATVSSCPSKRCTGYWVSLLGQSGLCAPRVVSHADFSVTASRSGAAPVGTRLCSSSRASRSTARTPYRSHWLGGGDAIIKPGVRASALSGLSQTKDRRSATCVNRKRLVDGMSVER